MLKKIFNTIKSNDSKLHQETRRKIANHISKTNISRIGRILRLPNDYDVLDSVYRLALYTFNNFPVPTSHIKYIDSHFKQIKSNQRREEIINSIIEQWRMTDDIFGIDLKLRAIEVVYSWGNFSVSEEQYHNIISMIDEVGKGIIRKDPMEYKHYGLTPPDVYDELKKRIPGLK